MDSTGHTHCVPPATESCTKGDVYLAICGCDGTTEAPGTCGQGGLVLAMYILRLGFLGAIIARSIVLCCAKGDAGKTKKNALMIDDIHCHSMFLA